LPKMAPASQHVAVVRLDSQAASMALTAAEVAGAREASPEVVLGLDVLGATPGSQLKLPAASRTCAPCRRRRT
jgi:hypothetical protein